MSRAETISLLVLGIAAVEVPVLVERVASADGPDISLIRVCFVALVALFNLVDMLEEVALEVTVSSAAVELTCRAIQANALVAGSIVTIKEIILIVFCCSRHVDCRLIDSIVEIPTASLSRKLELIAERDLCARELVIEQHASRLRGVERQLAELDLEILVVALCPYAYELDRSIRVLARVREGIDTGLYMPVVVDFSVRLEAEVHLVRVFLIFRALLVLIALAPVTVTSLAVPLYVVGIALEVADADTEVTQLIGELSSEFVNEGLVGSGDVRLGHGLGDHLSHLITRDVLVAAERRVAIAFDDAISCELGYSVISPVVSRDIGERVSSSKRRAGSADNESRRQCRYKSLFHMDYSFIKSSGHSWPISRRRCS